MKNLVHGLLFLTDSCIGTCSDVNIKVVNYSKQIFAMVYFTTIAVLESLILTLVLPGNHISLVLSAGHLVLAASAIVGLTFILKVWCINFHHAWQKNQVHNAFHCRWYSSLQLGCQKQIDRV